MGMGTVPVAVQTGTVPIRGPRRDEGGRAGTVPRQTPSGYSPRSRRNGQRGAGSGGSEPSAWPEAWNARAIPMYIETRDAGAAFGSEAQARRDALAARKAEGAIARPRPRNPLA